MNQTARGPLLAILVFVIGTLGFASSSYSHALQPGYLELRLLDDDLYAVVWKTPEIKSRPMAISALLPEVCVMRVPSESIWDGTAYVARWTTRCTGGLEGGVIQIDGLDQTTTDVLVRFDFSDGHSESRRLTPGDSFFTVPSLPSRLEVVRTYLVLGFQHIINGIDHLMFVLALLILVRDTRRLIITVTAFTLAHSLTLAGATLGFVHLPGPPIEASIALSIMFVAAEIMHSRQGKTGLTERYPWIVAFVFGLLHGFGFAGALAQIGLPQASIPMALLFFNVGVEAGQLFFIACVLAVVAVARRIMRDIDLARLSSARAQAVPPYVIGSLAAFWTLQRLAAF
jgi:hydrogenase/urease accessory protein HupE